MDNRRKLDDDLVVSLVSDDVAVVGWIDEIGGSVCATTPSTGIKTSTTG